MEKKLFKNSEIDEDAVIKNFISDFQAIKEMGFVPSHRSHNTGIGKTFEDLLGIAENNSKFADYKNILEIKSSRDLNPSLVTLFTTVPDYPPLANQYLRDTYGKQDPGFPELKTLHTTISAIKYNTYLSKYGFKLDIDNSNNRVYIKIKDIQSDDEIDDEIYIKFDTLKENIEKKCKLIAFITASTKIEGNTEKFSFISAKLLKGMSLNRFLSAIINGYIVYDIRIGVYRSGKQYGRPHDHGSGFRIFKKHIDKAFDIIDIT